MECIVYKQKSDGQIRIVHPNEKTGKTIEQFRARAEEADPTLTVECDFVGYHDPATLPKTREFRNQWRHNPVKKCVECDPVLEREERWRRIREERNKRLQETDAQALVSMERGTPNDGLKQYRQALRDITTQPDPKNIVWPTKP